MKINTATLMQVRKRFDKWIPLVYFLVVFCLYFSLLGTSYFTDEQDVYYGGYSLLKGGSLYQTYITQHMPFSYYIAWIPALLGARTVYQFRAIFYIILSLIWTVAYIHHRKHLPLIMLWGTPLIYLSMLKTQFMGTSLISDHWQGIGFVLIFYEMLRYPKTWRLSFSSCLLISLGIVLSLGTAFLSAYSLLFFFLGTVCALLVSLFAHRKEKINIKKIFTDLGKLILICIAPFLFLVMIYLIRGQFQDFWNGAYVLNREVYSKYLSGFGSDAGAAFTGVFQSFFHFIQSCFPTSGDASLEWLLHLVQMVGIVGCVIALCRTNIMMGLGIFAATICSGIRGFNGFHAMPFYAVSAAEISFCVALLFQKSKSWKSHHIVLALRAVTAAATLILLSGYIVPLGYNILMPQILLNPAPRSLDEYILLLTERNERIHACGTSVLSMDVMQTNRVPDTACLAVTNPWFYEMYGQIELEALKENQTNILIYDADEEVWGYTPRIYAPDFQSYVDEHYTNLGLANNLFVRNEFLPEALQRLEKAGYGVIGTSIEDNMFSDVAVDYFPGDSVTQIFRAAGDGLTAVHIRIGRYHGRSSPALLFEIYDHETGEFIGESTLDPDHVADNFFGRYPIKGTLTPGKLYEMRMTIEDIGGRGKIVLYFTPPGTATEDAWVITKDGAQDYSIPLEVEYVRY